MWRGYSCVRQDDQNDCGAAALATVALSYNLSISLQRLRSLAGTDRGGTNLFGLQEAAEALGFSARAAKGTLDALPKTPLPAIAHLVTEEGQGHFVVLHRFGSRHVIVADPATGLSKQPTSEFAKRWTGYLLLCSPTDRTASESGDQHGDLPTAAVRESGARELVPRARFGGPMSPLWRFAMLLARNRGILLESCACAFVMTVLGLSTSYFVQHLVDSILSGGDGSLLNGLGVGMVLIMLFRTLFAMLRQYLLAHIGRKVDLTLISDYARHVLHLPQSFFEMRQVGEIISRVNDASKVRDAVGGVTLTTIVDGVLVVFTTGVLWMYDGPLALVATLFSALLMALVVAHHPAARRASRRAMEQGADLSANLVENVSGAETFRAFGAQRDRCEETESRLARVASAVFSLQMLEISMSTAGNVVNATAGILILWFGGHRVIAGELTIGELMFCYTLLGYMLGPLQRLASVNLQMQDALIAIDRLYQVLDLDAEEAGPRKAELSAVRRGVDLTDISFRYGCRENVLADINLHIPAGSTVAIVGESGCGKSTLLKLLMRFYDASTGNICIDGVDVRDYSLTSLRERIGIVSQDPFIFNGSLRDNIALGQPDAKLDEIIAAAEVAGLTEFVAALPDRYDTLLGERGANLSGGQRQRLAIARAVLRDPDVLLMDEATSHLDTGTERTIQEKLRSVLAEKTVIIVAHRLSTVCDADEICVMQDGRIVEKGTHEQLLASKGGYAELWTAQSKSAAAEVAPVAIPQLAVAPAGAYSSPVGELGPGATQHETSYEPHPGRIRS